MIKYNQAKDRAILSEAEIYFLNPQLRGRKEQDIMSALNDFLNSIGAEAYTPAQNVSGCITIVNVTNSKRFKLSKGFAASLGNPSAINVHFAEDSIIIVAASENEKNAVKFSAGGLIYNSELAKRIMDLSGAEFPEGKSVRVGSYEMNQLEDGTSYAEVKFD